MQVNDELRVLVEAEVAQAIKNLEKFNDSLGDSEEKTKLLDKELTKIKKESEAATMGFEKMAKTLGGLAEVAVAGKALSIIKDMGAFALQTADNFQTARNQFGVLLGGMEAGAGLFNEIKAFNDVTPFDLDTLTQATNVLISAKVPLQDLQVQLTKFGDLSKGNSQKMTSYVNAFSQAAAKGKADMQVLNTYLHQGVPILDALAKNFNVTTAKIVEMSSQGQISFNDFSKALDDLTAAGGQYFGGMELSSKSLAAMQEGLNEAVNSLASSFGDMLLPAATDVVGIFTNLTNAINDSPIAKGFLAAVITSVTALMGVMAVKAAALTVKTWLAQAAQMGFNASLAVTNPLLLAGIAAAAAATAGYVVYAAKQQNAAKEAENLAYQQRQLNDAMKEGTNAVHDYYRQAQGFDLTATLNQINELQEKVAEQRRLGVVSSDEIYNLRTAIERFQKLRDEFIKEYYNNSTNEKIQELQNNIEIAQKYMVTVDISDGDREKLERIITEARAEIEKLSGDMNEKARIWKDGWAEAWEKFQADLAHDPFFDNETGRLKKLSDALVNYVDKEDRVIDQLNEYYNTQRGKIIRQLADDEERIQREMSRSRIDDLEYERNEAIRIIAELEQKRIASAQYTGEEIAEIQKRFADMREDLEFKFTVEIDKAKLDEARDAVKNWQEELSDNLLIALMNLEMFSDQASVIFSELTAQLIELSSSAALSGFEEFGRALGEGENAADSMSRALAAMAEQILKQLPMMFLQAGLQLIANGQWPLGLGFIAAAGSSAIISGYVDGAKKHAQGGVFDEYGQAARAYAAGGMFTNQVVSTPTYFAHGGGLGLMGEAGPEAIMPLKRMSNGDLGIQTAGGGEARVTVNIINNTNEDVRREEYTDGEGNKQIEVTIGDMINRHIMSGKADRVMGGHFGLRAAGV